MLLMTAFLTYGIHFVLTMDGGLYCDYGLFKSVCEGYGNDQVEDWVGSSVKVCVAVCIVAYYGLKTMTKVWDKQELTFLKDLKKQFYAEVKREGGEGVKGVVSSGKAGGGSAGRRTKKHKK